MGDNFSSSRKRNEDLERQLSYNTRRMNSSGSRYTPSGSNTEYSRDVDRLYVLYKPLRLAVYKDVASWLGNEVDKEDLTSFINEHFVRLVKEYDPTSNVDFPGYIKKMLTLRAKHSFTSTLRRLNDKEDSVGGQDALLSYISIDNTDNSVNSDEEIVNEYFSKFYHYVVESAGLEELDRKVLRLILTEHTNKYIAQYLQDEWGMGARESSRYVNRFRNSLKDLAESFNSGE